MLYLEVIKNLSNQLTDRRVTRSFMDAVEVRQRLFRQNRANVCVLDSYDMFSDHLLLRSRSDHRVAAYMRVTSASTCQKYDYPYPLEGLRNVIPGFDGPYARFRALAKEPLHMGYMCMDTEFRSEFAGLKLIELYAYLGFRCSGYPLDQVALSATVNAKYNFIPWLQDVGPKIEGLSDFAHPVIPESHQILMVPRVFEDYWSQKNAKFEAFYNSLRLDLDGAADSVAA